MKKETIRNVLSFAFGFMAFITSSLFFGNFKGLLLTITICLFGTLYMGEWKK